MRGEANLLSNGDLNLTQPLVEPLTSREREILNLLAQDYSAPEIAERLALTLSTVKWHIQQLYGKLGVNRRQRALRRGAALGLLESPLPALEPEPSVMAPQVTLATTAF